MKRRLRRLVLLVILIIVATPILTVLSVFSYFYLNQHGLKNQIVEFVNNAQPGEISIEGIDLSLFHDFPNVSLECLNVVYQGPSSNLVRSEIVRANQIFASINLRALWRGKVSINELSMKDGDFFLVVQEDTTLNLQQAFGEDFLKEKEEPVINLESDQKQIDFRMDEFQMNNMRVHFQNRLLNTSWQAELGVQANLKYANDTILTDHIIEIRDFQFRKEGNLKVEGIKLQLANEVEINLPKELYVIKNSQLAFEKVTAELYGSVNLKEDWIDIQFELAHSDFGRILSEGIWDQTFDNDQLDYGSIELNGSIIGPAFSSYPTAEVQVLCENVRVENLRGQGPVEKVNFQAAFSNGTGPDYSDGFLEISDIAADFPAGPLRGVVRLENFSRPFFDIELSSRIELDGIDRLLVMNNIDSLVGIANFGADISGHFDIDKRELVDAEGDASVTFEEVSFHLPPYDYRLDELNGRFFLDNNQIGVEDLELRKGGSNLVVDGNIQNLITFLLGFETPIRADLNLSSDRLNMMEAFNADTTLGNFMGQEYTDLDLKLSFETNSEGLNNDRLLPYGKAKLNNLGATILDKTSLRKVSGLVEITPDTISLNLSGYKDLTDFKLNAALVGYHSIMIPDTPTDLTISFGMRGDQLRFQDFFQLQGKDLIPPPYNVETIRNYKLAGLVAISNQELLGTKQIPDFRLEITEMGGRLVENPLDVKNLNLSVEVKGDTLLVNRLDGIIGDSDFRIEGLVVDNSTPTDSVVKVGDLVGEMRVRSKRLDLDQLMDIPVPESGDETVTSVSADFPEFVMDVEIGELEYFNLSVAKVRGRFEIKKPNQFILKKLEYELPAGKVALMGHADLSDSNAVRLDGEVTLDEIDLSKVKFEFVYDDRSMKIGDHFTGTLDGILKADAKIFWDGTIDLNDFNSTIEASLDSGRIQDFPALMVLADYFGNKDLTNIRFAQISNRIDIRDQQVQIPKMEISSTLGFMRIAGGQDFDGNLEYTVEVPFKLVSSVAWNTLVKKKRKENAAQDEIQTFGGKKYVTIRVGGTIDEPDIRIGKARKRR